MQKFLLSIALLFTCLLSFSQWTQTNGPEGGYTDEIVQVGSSMLLNSGRGGIYKSTNNGESWMPSNSGLPNNPHILDLIVDQGIFYLSMHGGIFKSVDDGNSWSEIETGLLSGTYYSLFVKGPYIFAGNANGGITYSKDNGLNWSYSGGEIAQYQFTDFEIFNSNFYAAGSGIGGGLYESKNEGASWERIEINGVGPNGVGTLHLSNNIFYLTTDFDILTSEDNLISWNKVLSTSTTGIKILSFGNRVYATSSAGKYYYTDDSVNWILVQNSSTNNSVNNLWVFEEKTIMSTSEGLYESTDSGASWLFNNSGINALHIQSLYADDESLFSGSEGQGIFRSLDSGNSWTPINAGLNAVNSKTINEIIEIDGILYIATGGGIYSSANSGRTWERNLDLGINRSADVLAFTNGALVTGDDDSIFISNDYGENWTEKEIDILEQPTSFLSLMAKDNMLVLGTVGGKILLSLNLGNTWSDISIPNEYYPSDFQLFEGDLYAAVGSGVFVSRDLGLNWERLNNSYFSIQDVMVTSEGIIAASGNGLFVTREDLNIWYPVTNEFSQTMTKIILQEETLFAGTFGSSVWQLPLIDALAVLPESEPNDFALRINTGGPEVIWSGDTFIADQYRTGGAVYAVDFPINETTNDELYQTEIYGPAVGPFTYEIPLEIPGEYDIRLHFAELYFGVQAGGLGSRVFNVSIEGIEVLSNFDILSEAAPAAALIKEFNDIQVSDGFATIAFTGVTQRAKISAIEILGLDTNVPDAPTLALIGEDVINLELGVTYLELGATATDSSGGDLSSEIVIGGDMVDTSMVGTYVITYNVTDGIGNSAEPLLRTVNVTEGSSQNLPDSDVNLALVTDAVLSGTNAVRGSLEAILYDPVTDDYFLPTAYNEYGVGFRENLGRPDADDGFVWRADWSSSKLINYITFGGVYPNQPQPNSLWRISYLSNGSWTVIEEGTGGWIDGGIFEWGGSSQSPISADALRVQVYSDGANDLISIHLRGRGGISNSINDSATATKATLIQYLPSEASLPFVTTWKTDNPGGSEDNQITIPVHPEEMYSYTIDWGDGMIETGNNGIANRTHTYDIPGIYQVSISGDFPRIYFNDPWNTSGGDNDKIISIDQWGSIEWSSMSHAFAGCDNLKLKATDAPNLTNSTTTDFMFSNCLSLVGNSSMELWDTTSITKMDFMFFLATNFNHDIGNWNVINVTNMVNMFGGASEFNYDIGEWDVSNVIEMTGMFSGATNFNQDIGTWNLSNTVGIGGMFSNATSFNQNIDTWNVSNVNDMSNLFLNASNFNQDISNWNVSNVMNMNFMFNGATSFNQNIGTWNTSSVGYMSNMFAGASSFNQDVGNWNTSSVINMSNLFNQASVFNQNIENWDTSNVERMDAMFNGATDFNQDIGGWDVAKVTDMYIMFEGATNFNQDLGDWNVSNVTNMAGMFSDVTLQTDFYDSLLNGWSNLELQSGVIFYGGNSQYCQGEEARQKLIDDFGWTIDDAGKAADCIDTTSFVTTWKTDNTGGSNDNQITFPGYSDEETYTIDWGDGSSATGVNQQITHSYAVPGTYTVAVSGGLNRFSFDQFGDFEKLLTIENWGDTNWSSLIFSGASNLDVVATDVPDLSDVSSFSHLFSGCSSLVGTPAFNLWDTNNITNMQNTFQQATLFNQPIGNWDLSNVTDINFMFDLAESFNQPIGEWNVGNVFAMWGTFSDAISFNQPIGDWDVSKVYDMTGTFIGAIAFNQDIGDWNVSGTGRTINMFTGATAFNQDLGNWNLSNMEDMNLMFNNSGMSTENYDATLIGWSENSSLQLGVGLDADGISYCLGEAARQKLIDDFGWIITDAGKSLDCAEPNDFALRINTGGPEVIWSGDTFIADQYRTGGAVYAVDFPINETTNDELYQTEIYGPAVGPFTYEIPLEIPGEYDIRLHFAELYFGVKAGGLGSRVFNVSIEGIEVLSNFDILSEAAPAAALIKEFNDIQVSDGFATIEFTGVTQRAKISAIEILGQGTNVPDAPTLALIGEDVINLELGVTYLELGATATDSSGDDLSSEIVIGGDMVDTNMVGTYVITYNVTDGIGNSAEPLLRTVNVTEGSIQNLPDSDVNLALLPDAVLSGTNAVRGSLEAILYDPVTDDYFTRTAYNEYGVGYLENLGRPDADDGFVWRADWSSSKLINYITFGGVYPNQPQPNSLWRISYLSNGSWTVIEEGTGGWIDGGIFEWGGSSQSPISADAVRVQVYSDGANDLISIHLRGRGGISNSINDSATATKATLIQYLPSEASLPFVTTWKTDNPGTSGDNQITIPTFEGETYNYTVEWGDGTSDSGVDGSITHTYPNPGTYEVSISGDFPRIYFFNASVEKDNEKLLEINQWGQIEWNSMDGAFYECKNMDMLASDIPNLSNVTDIGFMFDGCSNLIANESISEWDTSTITNMNGVFLGTMFNQDIGSWDTSLVEAMDIMFYYAKSFNQDIGDWDVSNLTAMVQMFAGAESFNQDISGWDVSNVAYMWDTFSGASSFNQNLANWDISKVEIFGAFIDSSGLSDENYNNMLIGWSQLPSLQNGLTLITAQNQFCEAKEARQKLIDDFGWTITDGGVNCPQRPFITTWTTDSQIMIPTHPDETYNYVVDWGDGTTNEDVTGNIVHTYSEPGTYTVSISGNFPRIYFSPFFSERSKINTIEQWGDIKWTSMEEAFTSCSNLDVIASDIPDLSLATSLRRMFAYCGSLESNESFENWEVSTIENMFGTFFFANSFDRDLSNWNVSAVTDMSGMFGANSGFSTESYDKTLIGWSQLPSLQTGVKLDVQNFYCLSENARQSILDNYGWTINDEGFACILEGPKITTSDFIRFLEHRTDIVLNVESTDNNDSEEAGLIYSLTGNRDDDLFAINADTGEISFIVSPDFDTPLDVGGNNLYNLIVMVIDSEGFKDTQDISILVFKDDGSNLDSDFDGVLDEFDLCPNTPSGQVVDENGCEFVNIIYQFIEENASKWFGGDNRPDSGPRNLGTGQSIFIEKPSIIESFSVKFSRLFDFPFNPEGVGHEVELVLQLRDSEGLIIADTDNLLSTNFRGGWVRFVFDTPPELNGNSTYYFTWFLKNGLANSYYNGSMGDNTSSFALGNGLNSRIDFGEDDSDFEDFNQWGGHTWDFLFKITGEKIENPQPDFTLRINTGGTEIEHEGDTFVADTYFNTGNVLDRPQTGLPEPFQTFRFSRSQEMSYDIPLEDGEYTVNLYFAELWFGATGGGTGGVGSRVFDVSIEGTLAEDNLDIFAEVGADAMLMRSHTVTVTGGVLDIDFDSRDIVGGVRHPAINAIEILGNPTGTYAPVTSITTTNVTSTSFTVEWTLDGPYTGQVEWGTTTALGNVTILESNFLNQHIQSAINLEPSTTYYYRVIGEDVLGANFISDTRSVKTLTAGDGKSIVVNTTVLSPNPVVTTTTLSFENPVELTTIQVFDVTGRLVHTYEAAKVSDNGAYLLNVHQLPAGTYFLKSHDIEGQQYQKQMVIKK